MTFCYRYETFVICSEILNGIISRVEYKLSLYADLLLYITDPTDSVPPVLDILETSGSFSGFKQNLGIYPPWWF